MKFCANKDVDRLIRTLVASGWQCSTGKKHNKMISPDGAIVVFSKTPSDGRAYLNFKSSLRKYAGWDTK